MLASGGRDGTIRLWDAEAGQEFLKFTAHNTGVRQVAFSPNDGTLISIESLATRESRTAHTDGSGFFGMLGLPPGEYRVAAGGKTSVVIVSAGRVAICNPL